MNSSTFKVAKFEIIRQLKKPAFWAATLLMPLLIGGIYFVSFISGQHAAEGQKPVLDENTKVAITDEAGVFSSNAPFVINGDNFSISDNSNSLNFKQITSKKGSQRLPLLIYA